MQRMADPSSSSTRKPLVLGITGTTNAGKTTLAKKLVERFPGSRIIHQDDFFREIDDPEHEHVENLNHHNWDCLSAIKVDELIKTFHSFRDEMGSAGHQTTQSTGYSNGHSTQGGARGRSLLIVEGILVLNISEISEACDLKYFLHLTEEECKARRLLRNYDPPDVPGYYEHVVYPMHLYYSAQLQKRYKDVCYIEGTDDAEKTFQKVLSDIAGFGFSPSPKPLGPIS